jgi:hypothetical protein
VDPDPAFNLDADPDPALNLNAAPDPNKCKSMRIRTRIMIQTFASQKIEFFNGSFGIFGQFLSSWIQIRIPKGPKPDLDPGEPNQCGSGSTTLLVGLNLTRRSSPYYNWREPWV